MRNLIPILVVVTILMRTTHFVFGAAPASGDLLKDALDSAAKIDSPSEKADMLNDIVMAQARTGDFAGAQRVAATIDSPLIKSFAYAHVADSMAQAGDIDGAKALLATAGNDNSKSGIYESVADAQAAKGDIAAAKATAANITVPFSKSHALKHIALAQVAAGDLDGAKATIATIEANDVVVQAYVGFAEIQAKAGNADESQKTIALATDAAGKVPAFLTPLVLSNIATAQIHLGNPTAAMQILDGVADPNQKTMVIVHIAQAQIEMGDLVGAKSMASKLTSPNDKISVYAKLARPRQKAAIKQAQEIVKQAIALADTIEIPPLRGIATEGIGTAQAQVNDPTTAAQWARALKDPEVGCVP